jgi:HPt (histidine-containing phosphotransfer) domain-containing protein
MKQADVALTQTGSEHGSIDPGALDNIRSLQKQDRPNLVGKVINIYLEESPKLLTCLRDAIPGGDTTAMTKAAHSLKSSSANVGASALATLCKELEALGRASSTENAPQLLSGIEAEFERVQVALTEELKENTS